jgi:two-component system chemotaxis sensor kinase CheA
MDTIGEMGIYSSMLISKARSLLADHPDIINTSLQVEKFSKELQSIGMSMRLIPIRGLFQKMSRLVWDTSKKLGKEVKFIMHGEDTELDRSIIDTLADPLMHMVRNALDHGLESPEERISAGKSPTGIVELSAYHSGGNIHIKIRDDGRGLDPNKLINKAKEKGILGKDETLSDSEAYQLIFAAGFSTASVVTDLSGRGVGMDVVRRNIESMRGRIMIDSSLGKGTTFTIELPLTLAIIDGIQVGVGDQSYLIPTLSVVELLRAKDDQLTRTLDKGETFKFRDRYLPVFRLNELFGITPKYNTVEDSLFVIVETGGEQFVLMCDEILGSLSTVIKSLGDTFGPQRGLSGCCVMPDGSVSLILDVRSILHLAREQYTHRRRHG